MLHHHSQKAVFPIFPFFPPTSLSEAQQSFSVSLSVSEFPPCLPYPQVTGKCPTVSIDKTDGCQVFLSKDSLTAEIITAKSSEMNICIPKGNAGDFVSEDSSSSLFSVYHFLLFVDAVGACTA